MSEPFVGEIRMFGGNFAPRGWALCDGQLLSINSADALFSLLGTIYGGDGRTTFGLPDLRGRIPVHPGSGPGLDTVRLGERAGVEAVALQVNELPAHTHAHRASTDAATNAAGPGGNLTADAAAASPYGPDPAVALSDAAVANTGGSRPHTNMGPSLGVNFIIALVGIYPST